MHLASHRLFPYTNARCTETNQKIIVEMVCAPAIELCVLPCFGIRRSWFHSWN